MSGDPQKPAERIALFTDFTPDFLQRELEQAAQRAGLPVGIHSVNPHSREAALRDPDSALYRFKPGVVLIGLSGPLQWSAFQSQPPGPARLRFGEERLEECREAWELLRHHLPRVKIWQSDLGPFPDGISGTEARRDPKAFAFQRDQFNRELVKALIPYHDATLIDWSEPVFQAGTRTAYDSRLWLTAGHPFALPFLPELIRPVMNRLLWQAGRFIKVLVVDLDNTLWGGEVGETGPAALQVGQEGIGNVYRNFQLWLRHLKDEGILLAVVSKNDPDKAREGIARHPENILSLEDFAVFKAGWNPKSDQIREVANELNIGLDSFCFIDDSPFEREEVRARLPQVSVPDMPPDPADWIPYLGRCALFESGAHSTADTERTRWVREEQQRRSRKTAFKNYVDYLRSLEMRGRMAPLQEEHVARAHQLVMRTNQFNLRTIRHSKETLEEIMRSPSWKGWVFGLEDKFGDYGWISLVLLEDGPTPGRSAFIDTWVMSCRVFERGMEHWILNQLVTALRESGYGSLEGEFIETPKNARFSDLLERLGFIRTGNTRWRLDLARPPRHDTCIQPA